MWHKSSINNYTTKIATTWHTHIKKNTTNINETHNNNTQKAYEQQTTT